MMSGGIPSFEESTDGRILMPLIEIRNTAGNCFIVGDKDFGLGHFECKEALEDHTGWREILSRQLDT